MLEWLFLRKATEARIRRIFEEENFIFAEEDIQKLLGGNEKGTRYGNGVFVRNENDSQERRFLKILLDGKRSTFKLFKRQVLITDALHKDATFPQPKMAAITFSFKSPVPYAIFETRETGEDFGFMHDAPEYYERLTEQDVQRLVEVIYSFHHAGFSVDASTLRLARPIASRAGEYKKEAKLLLRTRIMHKTPDGETIEKTVEDLLAYYSGLSGVSERIGNIFDDCWSVVALSRVAAGKYLVHADMQLDNAYRHRDGNFELLDFEWVGKSDNPVVPIMFDYGNLRARAWSSPSFQAKLDAAMRQVTQARGYDMQTVEAGLRLGVLRSSLMMSRYHMDFKNTVKKDKRTEEDYFAMFPKTLASLIEALK